MQWPSGEGAGVAAHRGDGRRLWTGVVLWALVAAASLVAVRPPAPLGEDAPAEVASGARARAVLERLARGEGGRLSPPRPPGSAAGRACADRIVLELTRLGLRPEVQEVFGVSARSSAAGLVRNVVARIPGNGGLLGPRQSILCMAHYDSVGAGPGIGDDLSGVAALLEAARALLAGPPARRDVLLLFEDGEEHGLLGAEAFAAEHPLADRVGAVVNLEARGTTGPSRLFEFGPDNARSIEAFAAVAERASTSSVSAEIYRRMPNDTDYTVWRERGIQGLNFAFIGEVHRYHTALDDLENLSPGSLQHHTSNALDAVRALDSLERFRGEGSAPAAGDVSADRPVGDAVFSDVLGRWIPTVRVRTARLWAWGVLLAALLGIGRAVRRGGARPLRVGAALLGLGLAWALMVGAAGAEGWLMGVLGQTSSAWPAHRVPVVFGLLAAGSAGAAIAAGLIQRFALPREVAAAGLGAMALLSAGIAFEAPGAVYLTLVPTTVLALAALLMRTRGDIDLRWCRAGTVAVALAALTVTPIHAGMIGAFGVRSAGAVAAPLALVATFFLPLLVRARGGATAWFAATALASALLAAAFVGRLDAQTLARPGQHNLVHVQASGSSMWVLRHVRGDLSPGLSGDLVAASGTGSGGGDEALGPEWLNLPWTGSTAALASASPLDLAVPGVELVSRHVNAGGGVDATLRVTSARGADQLIVQVSGARLRIAGRTLEGDLVRFLGPRAGGEVLDVSLPAGEPLRVDVWDKRFGFDPAIRRAAEPLLAALPAEFVPVGDGNGSLVQGRFEFDDAAGDGEVPE